MSPSKSTRSITHLFLAAIVVIIVLAGAFAAALAETHTSTVTETQTSPPTTVTVNQTQTRYGAITSITIMPSQVISLWQAMCSYYCGSNHTSIPANVTAELALYQFFLSTSGGKIVGGYTISNITVELATGLPEQQVVEPFPDGVVVDASVSIPNYGNASCVVYMLIWSVIVPSKIPNGGSSYVNALSGLGIDPRAVSNNLTCPPANV
ncbi:MAG: hypothetical protein ABSE82_15100, partial [Nitrososphaerales archaeon]